MHKLVPIITDEQVFSATVEHMTVVMPVGHWDIGKILLTHWRMTSSACNIVVIIIYVVLQAIFMSTKWAISS